MKTCIDYSSKICSFCRIQDAPCMFEWYRERIASGEDVISIYKVAGGDPRIILVLKDYFPRELAKLEAYFLLK